MAGYEPSCAFVEEWADGEPEPGDGATQGSDVVTFGVAESGAQLVKGEVLDVALVCWLRHCWLSFCVGGPVVDLGGELGVVTPLPPIGGRGGVTFRVTWRDFLRDFLSWANAGKSRFDLGGVTLAVTFVRDFLSWAYR